MTITNDAQLEQATNQLLQLDIQLERSQGEPTAEMVALAAEIERYEQAAGYVPEPPATPEGQAQVAAFIARMKARNS